MIEKTDPHSVAPLGLIVGNVPLAGVARAFSPLHHLPIISPALTGFDLSVIWSALTDFDLPVMWSALTGFDLPVIWSALAGFDLPCHFIRPQWGLGWGN